MNKALILVMAIVLFGATSAEATRMRQFVNGAVAGAARSFLGYKPSAGATLSGDCSVRAVDGRKMLDCRFEKFENPALGELISLFKAALPGRFRSSKCTLTGAYPHEDIMEETCFREPGGVEADVGTDDSGAAHLYFFAPRQMRRTPVGGGGRSNCKLISPGEKLYGFAGYQRRSGLRAARVSSKRPTTVVSGAAKIFSGSRFAVSTMSRSASTKPSSVSFDSVSVGSIIRHSGTMSGK